MLSGHPSQTSAVSLKATVGNFMKYARYPVSVACSLVIRVADQSPPERPRILECVEHGGMADPAANHLGPGNEQPGLNHFGLEQRRSNVCCPFIVPASRCPARTCRLARRPGGSGLRESSKGTSAHQRPKSALSTSPIRTVYAEVGMTVIHAHLGANYGVAKCPARNRLIFTTESV